MRFVAVSSLSVVGGVSAAQADRVRSTQGCELELPVENPGLQIAWIGECVDGLAQGDGRAQVSLIEGKT